MFKISTEFIAAGGNRHPSAASWSPESNILAYGSGCNIALWDVLDKTYRGVCQILSGHAELVNAVTFCPATGLTHDVLLSGSVDKTIKVWTSKGGSKFDYVEALTLSQHTKSVNVIETLRGTQIFVSGGADSEVKIWRLSLGNDGRSQIQAELLQTISLQPKFLPLALSLSFLPGSKNLVLAVAGSTPKIYVYVSSSSTISFQLKATLTGHEGWIRALDFAAEKQDGCGDLLLASASQDKYIRLWRLHAGSDVPVINTAAKDAISGAIGRSMSNKVQHIDLNEERYSLTFEALLLGHEDWIYNARWRSTSNSLKLLSASADNSLAIWEADPSSGIWICTVRLGEISAQKGATTATGSTGGFWIGLWSSDGENVVSLGRTGSWRLWKHNSEDDRWIQNAAVSGHIRDVKDIAWSRDGSYLLSTSSDQTTKLFAEWKRENCATWHEISRPQIHGYDLNCIDTISNTQFISGADEKLLRVFDEPKAVAALMSDLCGVETISTATLPDAANIPVLGLSNKAIEVDGGDAEDGIALEDASAEEGIRNMTLTRSDAETAKPPLEDQLARHLLWPEGEKLYGHGYEISAVAVSRDGNLVATACRASSVDHAVIRFYDTKEWREVKPALKSHSLTVTRLAFSPDDAYLLSVGRDRKCTVFARATNNASQYNLLLENSKAHSRMILDAAWAPGESGPIFATAGRDKAVNLWKIEGNGLQKLYAINTSQPVTAVSFLPFLVRGRSVLSYGLESGLLYFCSISSTDPQQTDSQPVEGHLNPSKAITRLRWRPLSSHESAANRGQCSSHLAIASEDYSLRIYMVEIR